MMHSKMKEDCVAIKRKFSPIAVREGGEMDFLIKEYPKGKLTGHIAAMKPKQTIVLMGVCRRRRPV